MTPWQCAGFLVCSHTEFAAWLKQSNGFSASSRSVTSDRGLNEDLCLSNLALFLREN